MSSRILRIYEDTLKIVKDKDGVAHFTIDDYKNNRSRLIVECKEGHLFDTTRNVLQAGHWCNQCTSLIRERMCRKIFEDLTGFKFPKSRPEWLKYINPLELDGYCKELKLAFEYNGKQHYEKVWKFISTDIEKRDEFKIKRCIENNVDLIVIPYYVNVEKYIRVELSRRKLIVNETINKFKLAGRDDEVLEYAKNKLLPEQEIIDVFYSGTWYSTVRCSRNHTRVVKVYNVGSMCPKCVADEKYKGDSEIQELEEKICNRCNIMKPKTEYCRSGSLAGGLQSWCKPCLAEYKRQWKEKKKTK